MPETRFQGIGRNLMDWFAANARDLPWRLHYTPYEVWISEIMLQQTQVKTMLPYYHRWMSLFPQVRKVALAPEEDLLKAWEGMGYYSRARNIHKTARVLVEDFGAEFPRDHGLLLTLPGIGRYTAGAIMSIAFNADCAAVDGNGMRIISRLFGLASSNHEQQRRKACWDIAERLVPRGKARSFNQAIMDLGALVCTPRNPLCSRCPVLSWCRGYRSGAIDPRAGVKKPRKIVPIHAALGILVREGRIFIQKRPPSGLMPHLWEFPGGKLQHGEFPEEALVREFQEELGVTIGEVQKFALIRHHYTTFRVTLHAFTCRLEDADRQPVLHAAVDGRWATPAELDLYAFPAANRKLIQLIQENRLEQDQESWMQESLEHS